jgi:ArsR family transcriptional regulator
VLNLSQPNASRHLIKLKYAKLITSEKQAQWVYYRVDKTSLERYPFVQELLAEELEQQPHCQKDFARLQKYRGQGGCCETKVKIKDVATII